MQDVVDFSDRFPKLAVVVSFTLLAFCEELAVLDRLVAGPLRETQAAFDTRSPACVVPDAREGGCR